LRPYTLCGKYEQKSATSTEPNSPCNSGYKKDFGKLLSSPNLSTFSTYKEVEIITLVLRFEFTIQGL
jgi:hypothetical protein